MSESNVPCLKFPIEIYEHIFSYLDGYTLIQVEKVCDEWKEIVQWLGKKTKIWKNTCYLDMPRKVLLTMYPKVDCELNIKHEVLYRNWFSWQHVSNFKTTIISSKNVMNCDTLKNITCAKISGNHIIYGTVQGVIGVLLDTFQLKQIYNSSNRTMVYDIFFINHIETNNANNYYQHSHLLVTYRHELKLFALSQNLIEITSIFLRTPKISVYDIFFCTNDEVGYVEVFKVDLSASLPEEFFLPVTSFRLYRPMMIESLNIFDKIVTVVTKNKILKLDFNKDAPKWKVGMGQLLPFPDDAVDRFWTFYHEVVFANGYTDLYVTTITNDKETPAITHTFNWMHCLGGRICDIHYYANNLFITTHEGQVFIYVIRDWSTFNLMKYDYKVNLDTSPIVTLDFQEFFNEHRFIAATHDSIHQIFLYQKF